MSLKERLLKLQKKGVKVAPVIEGPSFHFTRGGRFRAYYDNGEVEVHRGEATPIIEHMKMRGCSVLQRLSEKEWAEHYKISSHDPFTGEHVLFGVSYNAQGEERPISTLPQRTLQKIKTFVRKTQRILRDAVTIEFVRVKGARTYTVLNAHPMVRSRDAAIIIAHDMAELGLIKPREAVCRISAQDISVSTSYVEIPEEKAVWKGIPASSGVVVSKIRFSVDKVKKGETFILCTRMTTPEEVAADGLVGIITRQGGYTSHAAIVARSRGIPCLVGTEVSRELEDQETITLDGNRGLVFKGAVEVLQRGDSPELQTILEWAQEHQEIGVYANADTPEEVAKAVELGAEGIGLCRTEHMMAPTDRLLLLQKALLVPDEVKRVSYLWDLYEHQKKDFVTLLKAAQGRPIIIRLLDAPMHEILPHTDQCRAIIKEDFGGDMVAMMDRKARLVEQNPMLGHRGCRLGITIPDIYAMQIQAIMVAAKEVPESQPSIMVPMVSTVQELTAIQGLVIHIWEKLGAGTSEGARIIPVGAMVETPRAAITADELASHADFLSFGTNDLTQMAYGFSRDDTSRFLPDYLSKMILEHDPFVSLDERGIGRLMRISIEMIRKVSPDMRIGICGVHAGDPKSIALCAALGVDYVSCSPGRIRGAKLTVAQWSLRDGE